MNTDIDTNTDSDIGVNINISICDWKFSAWRMLRLVNIFN